VLSESKYLLCIILDNFQHLTTALRSVLATQRVLEGVGVGRIGATTISATLNLLIRDISGMFGKLLFTSFAAGTFRRNIKWWKFFSETMTSLGITLEILAPSFTNNGSLFLSLLCLGTLCKSLSKVASGACVPGLQMFWAVKLTGSEEAISDVAVKSGAQRTATGGLGMILAGITAQWLSCNNVDRENMIVQKWLWIGLYCGLTALHLLCNWMSLKLVTLDWPNGWRLHRLVNEFLTAVDEKSGDFEGIRLTCPSEMSKAEPILFFPGCQSMKSHLSGYPIRLGVSFNQLARLSGASSAYLQSSLRAARQNSNNYVLKVGHNKHLTKEYGVILVSLFAKCSKEDQVKAYFQACLVGRELANLSASNCIQDEGSEKTEELWPSFQSCASEAGWKLNKAEFATEGWTSDHEC
jgi:hypothetical protein